MQVPSMVNESLQILDNKYISAMIGLFLALYAGLAAPKLPKYITIYFDNPMFKLGVMFLIAYMATKDPPVAIIASVALLVSLQTLSSQKTTDKVVKAVKSKVNTIQSEVEKSKYLKDITEGFADDSDKEEYLDEEDYEPPVKLPPVELPPVKQTVELPPVELKQIHEVMKPITEQVIKKQEVTIPIQVQADAATEAAVQAHAEAAAQAQAAEKAAAQAQAAEKAATQAAEEKMKAELIAQAQAAQAAQAQVAAAQAQAQAAQAQATAQAAQEPNGCGQVVNTTISGYDLNAEFAPY
jgi:hypothetical protein